MNIPKGGFLIYQMKKICFLVLFFIFVGMSFAQEIPNRDIFLEGTAVTERQRSFFYDNFLMEGNALGYFFVTDRSLAGYTVRFAVEPHLITYSDGSTEPAPPEDGQYIITLRLIRNTDNFEMTSLGFSFNELEEMYEFNQYILFRTIVSIPPADDDGVSAIVNNNWRRNRLYLRVSIDYPIRFFLLQRSSDLIGGVGVYSGTFSSPTGVSPMDHKFLALPGATFGLEFQFIDWLSIEPYFSVFLGDTNRTMFINMQAGGNLKYHINFFQDVVLAPYLTFAYDITQSSAFAYWPKMAAGGGFQVLVRGTEYGSFFLNVSYLMSLGLSRMHNPLIALYPNPPTIGYRHHSISFSFGYRHGFIRR